MNPVNCSFCNMPDCPSRGTTVAITNCPLNNPIEESQGPSELEKAIAAILIRGYKSQVLTGQIAVNDAKLIVPELLRVVKREIRSKIWHGANEIPKGETKFIYHCGDDWIETGQIYDTNPWENFLGQGLKEWCYLSDIWLEN